MPSTRRRREIPDPGRNETLSEIFGDFTDRLHGDRWQPAVDVFETESAVIVRAEISGVAGEDLQVNIDGERLSITGVRRNPPGAEIRRLHQVEIAFGPFERTIHVKIPFERERVSAHLEDGFLVVTMPKRLPRRVEVETE